MDTKSLILDWFDMHDPWVSHPCTTEKYLLHEFSLNHLMSQREKIIVICVNLHALWRD